VVKQFNPPLGMQYSPNESHENLTLHSSSYSYEIYIRRTWLWIITADRSEWHSCVPLYALRVLRTAYCAVICLRGWLPYCYHI